MSGNIVQGIATAKAGPKPANMMQAPPAPLIAPTGSPGLNMVIGAVNDVAAPFQALPSGEGGAAGAVANGLGAVLGVVGAPEAILDSAFAALTAPIAKIFPALPAVTLLGMHIGPPHAHMHPPSLVPPAPPVPLPSLGMLVGAGSLGVLVGGLPAARAGDIGIAVTCGGFLPPFEVHTGSSNVFIGGSRAARMGDITRHCNPVAMAGLGLAMAIAGVAAGAAGAIAFGSKTAAAQAAADAVVLALKMVIGKDLAVPPGFGALIGPPAGNVMIGGFPCPPLMESLMGCLKKLKKPPKPKNKASDGDNAPCGKPGHPVRAVTGACTNTYVEFVSGGLFEWKRDYSSDRGPGPLGYGSRHTYQQSLGVWLHRAVLTNWNGEEIVFPRFERGSKVTRAKGYVLTRVDTTTYRVKYMDEPELEFVGDRFFGDLQLVRVRKEHKELVITRDAAGRISAFTETDFKAQTQRRFELMLDANGRIQQLVEVPAGPFAPPQPILRRAYTYSEEGDLIASGEPNAYPQRFGYDAQHRMTKELDPLGYAFTYVYDEQGRVIETTGQDGLWAVKLAYPKEGLTRTTYPDGASYDIHYDKEGAITEVVASDGHTLKRVLDVEGRVEVEIDGAGRQMRWLYDSNGAHYARMDDFGHLLPTAVDAPYAPNPFHVDQPRTPLEWLLGDFAPRRGRRDNGGLWPISWNGPAPAALAGLPQEVANMSRGLFALREGSRQPAPPPRVELDPLGRKIAEADERGATRRWYYDMAGNLVAEQDRDGYVRRFTIASWNLRGEETNEVGQTLRYRYSSLAKVTEVVDPFGLETRYDYDQRERLVRVHRHGGVREEYIYDVDSHFIEKRDGNGHVLFKNEAHKNHLVGKRTLTSGGYHKFDYDDSGRVTEASTQDHEVKLTYDPGDSSYDPVASPDYTLPTWPEADLRDGKGVKHVRRKSTLETYVFERFRALREQGEARAVLRDPTGRETTLAYDQGIVRRYCPNGTIETLQFDPEGRLLARLVYRASNRLPQLGAATPPPPPVRGAPRDGCWGTRYSYTLEGDLVRIDDTARGTTLFEVDKAHRLAAEVTPRGERLEYVQDGAGNVVSKPGLNDLRLLRGNFLAASRDERFEHDTRHHLALRERHDGAQVRYRYDSFDMLVAIEYGGPGGESWRWEASYDALGRRTRVNRAGKTREFFWDYERLAAEIQPDGRLRLYQYASRTARVPIGFTDYDSVDAPPESGKSYVVFSNPVGLPLCIEDQEGNTVWWAERVDPYGAIQVAGGSSIEYNLRWPGHYYDPETGLHYNRWRYYDPILGRYLQSDPLGYGGSPVNLYAYAPNPLVQVDMFGLECEGPKDGDTPRTKGNDGQEKAPDSAALKAMTPKQREAYCRQRAAELNQQLRDKDAASNKRRQDAWDNDPRPESEKGPRPKDTHFAENGTTVCVGVVKDKDGNMKTVVTSSKDRGPPPVKLKDGEEYRPTGDNPRERSRSPESQPELAPGGRETGREVEARDRNGNVKTDEEGNPIMVPEREEGSRRIIRDEQGNKIGEEPYEKASTSELRKDPNAPGSTEHHAEQRMANGARERGEEIDTMSPSKECCPGCHRALDESGDLDKIPSDLQGKPPGQG